MALGVVRGIAEVVVAPGTDVVFTPAMHLNAFHIGACMAPCAELIIDELRPMQWTRSVLTPSAYRDSLHHTREGNHLGRDMWPWASVLGLTRGALRRTVPQEHLRSQYM